jgi:hypothetical protein
VGGWIKPIALASSGQYPWWISLFNGGTSENPWAIKTQQADFLYFEQVDGANYCSSRFSATPPTLGQWQFFIGRVGAAFLRAQGMLHDGSWVSNSATNTSGGLETSGYTLRVGTNVASQPHRNSGAEFFVCSPDPFAGYGNADVPRDIIRQLAYYGAASIPHVLEKMIFYASFWNGIAPLQNGHYWVNNGSHLVSDLTGGSAANQHARWQSDHPPLAPGYMRPNNPIATRII